MAASPNIVSHGSPMLLTKDEATAAQRTWPFYLSNSADGTPATGKTIATTDFKISKNGAAFGNAVGTVTEMSLGWYKMVFDAGDVDTLGTLACELSGEAGVDPIHVSHQVVAFDVNVATVAPTAGSIAAASFAAGAIDAAAIADGAIDAATFAAGAINAAAIAADAITAVKIATGAITAAKFAAGAIDAAAIAANAIGASELAADAVAEMQSGLATGAQVLNSRQVQNVLYHMGDLTADGSTDPIGLMHAVSAVVALTGTWDSSTVTVERCDDVLADPQVWTTYASGAKTSDATVAITGPVAGLRATMSNDGASSEIAVDITIVS
jgi:hypothetical protein